MAEDAAVLRAAASSLMVVVDAPMIKTDMQGTLNCYSGRTREEENLGRVEP